MVLIRLEALVGCITTCRPLKCRAIYTDTLLLLLRRRFFTVAASTSPSTAFIHFAYVQSCCSLSGTPGFAVQGVTPHDDRVLPLGAHTGHCRLWMVVRSAASRRARGHSPNEKQHK